MYCNLIQHPDCVLHEIKGDHDMNTKNIAIAKKLMKPMSDQEVREFMQKRHPRFCCPAPTDDAGPSADRNSDALPSPKRKPLAE